jgi:uncharacterized protein
MLNTSLVLASLTAGLLGGIHCVGMCGGITNILTSPSAARKIIPILPSSALIAPWRKTTMLHSGRIFTYVLMGSLVGAIGTLGMRANPFLQIHSLLYFIGNLALIWLGLRLFGYTPGLAYLDRLMANISQHIKLPHQFSLLSQAHRFPFLSGMLWGLLPCGLVYGVLPFALLSGDAYSGALLMLIFGLAALPYLLFTQGIAQWVRHSKLPKLLRGLGASALLTFGILGLWWSFNMSEMPAFLCITPTH